MIRCFSVDPLGASHIARTVLKSTTSGQNQFPELNRKEYTFHVKSFLHLLTTRFPLNCPAHRLDTIARLPYWQRGEMAPSIIGYEFGHLSPCRFRPLNTGWFVRHNTIIVLDSGIYNHKCSFVTHLIAKELSRVVSTKENSDDMDEDESLESCGHESSDGDDRCDSSGLLARRRRTSELSGFNPVSDKLNRSYAVIEEGEEDVIGKKERRLMVLVPLTLVPIDSRMIDQNLLSANERQAFDKYNDRVFETFAEKQSIGYANPAAIRHLRSVTKRIA
ncbi:hypothetical protein ACOME3_005522 [Neoechinorhynchus agilis]